MVFSFKLDDYSKYDGNALTRALTTIGFMAGNSQMSVPRDARAFGMGVFALILMVMSGCGLSNWVHNGFKIGPQYCQPTAAVADDWIDADSDRLYRMSPQNPDWWAGFNDPILTQLIESSFQQNLTLREAGLRVLQAQSIRAIAAGNLFPQTQQAYGQYDRLQNSNNVALPGPLTSFDQWSTGFNLSWELDVWGRFRRQVASADADLEASFADFDGILLCLISDVATAYADYRTFQKRLRYAERNVEIQRGSLELTQEKADAGATDFTGVHLAKSSLEATRAAIPSLETGKRQSSNRLCTLLGMPPQDLTEMLGEGPIPRMSQDIAIGVPVDLLRRRPDIVAAERAIAAQSEQIGIATSDLYPHFTIDGSFTLESERLSDLFSSASSGGSVGPAFRWNLLNYGRIINNIRLQGYGLEELIASYQNQVLVANQEVEDAMVAFVRNLERVDRLDTSANETAEALRLLTISFEEGEIDFTGVFVLQGSLANAQDKLATAEGDALTSLIQLFKALGGGWEVDCLQCVADVSCLQEDPGNSLVNEQGTVELPVEQARQNDDDLETGIHEPKPTPSTTKSDQFQFAPGKNVP